MFLFSTCSWCAHKANAHLGESIVGGQHGNINKASMCLFLLPRCPLVEELPLSLPGAAGILLQVFGCSHARTALPKLSSPMHKAALAPGFPHDAADTGLASQNDPK